MVDTMVCAHGWPIFDQEPCPDCIKDIDREATGAVTDDFGDSDPLLAIPDFLKRDPDTGKVFDCRPDEAQNPVGGGTLPSTAAPAFAPPAPGQPGYVSSQHGNWTDDDQRALNDVATGTAITEEQKTRKRLQKAGFVKAPSANHAGEYADGKRWDSQVGKWL